jgi:hypothetical protein
LGWRERNAVARAREVYGERDIPGLLAPPTEAEWDGISMTPEEARELRARFSAIPRLVALCDAYLAQREALRWYDDHKRTNGSYDGEMWGDLSAAPLAPPERKQT